MRRILVWRRRRGRWFWRICRCAWAVSGNQPGGRWATEQVGRRGRTAAEAAKYLGCAWDTIDRAANRWGEALLAADTDRVGAVDALGLDETLFQHRGKRRTRMWMTSAVDVRKGQLIDIFPGKDAKSAIRWLLSHPAEWREGIQWAALDLSPGLPARLQPGAALGGAGRGPVPRRRDSQPKVDGNRRVQEETLGRRGRKQDNLYQARNLLTPAREKLDGNGKETLWRLFDAGDPLGGKSGWSGTLKKPSGKNLPNHRPQDADEFTRLLAQNLQHESCPPVLNQLGKTLHTWHPQIVAWHRARVNQRLHRNRQQSHQTHKTRSVRVPQLPQLPNPAPPLRRQTQLEPTPYPHPPLKPEEPL